jgi:hypothetical protein
MSRRARGRAPEHAHTKLSLLDFLGAGADDFPLKAIGSGTEDFEALVGIDSLNIDDIDDGNRPVHTRLLAARIPIAEHLAHLEHLPDRDFKFFAVPVKVRGFGTFPVRAFGVVPNQAGD